MCNVLADGIVCRPGRPQVAVAQTLLCTASPSTARTLFFHGLGFTMTLTSYSSFMVLFSASGWTGIVFSCPDPSHLQPLASPVFGFACCRIHSQWVGFACITDIVFACYGTSILLPCVVPIIDLFVICCKPLLG